MDKDERKALFFSFYDQLTPEHAELAKSNYDSVAAGLNSVPDEHKYAISRGFHWDDTKQGYGFWNAIHRNLAEGDYPLQLTPQECTRKAKEHVYTAPPTEPNFGTEDVLQEALRITGGDRMNDYGPPDQDFARTAVMWEQILNSRIKDRKLEIKPQDVAACMIALKLSRQTHQGKRDNWVDIAGYARCGNLCEELEDYDQET